MFLQRPSKPAGGDSAAESLLYVILREDFGWMGFEKSSGGIHVDDSLAVFMWTIVCGLVAVGITVKKQANNFKTHLTRTSDLKKRKKH